MLIVNSLCNLLFNYTANASKKLVFWVSANARSIHVGESSKKLNGILR